MTATSVKTAKTSDKNPSSRNVLPVYHIYYNGLQVGKQLYLKISL